MTDPVRAKTLTLWYEGIRAEGWDTNSDKQAVSITHGGFSATEIPPHGATEFFIEIAKPELRNNPIEWHISDTHQGIVIRTRRGEAAHQNRDIPSRRQRHKLG